MYLAVHRNMVGLSQDPNALGAGKGLQSEENAHVVLLLHCGPQILGTLVTGVAKLLQASSGLVTIVTVVAMLSRSLQFLTFR